MPLELKGLKGKALKAVSNVDRLNAAYDAFNEAAPLHAADVEGLTPQITELSSDLEFAVQVLGNSVNGSPDSQKQPPVSPIVPPVVSIEAPAPPAQAPTVSQQTAALGGLTGQVTAQPMTFRAEAEQQIAAGHK